MKNAALVVAVIIGLFVWAMNSDWYADYQTRGNMRVAASQRPEMSHYQDNAVALEYRKAILEEYEQNTPLFVEGKVFQVSTLTQGIDFVQIYAGKSDATGNYIRDNITVIWDEPKVLNGDVVRIYARYRGAPEYENVLRAVEKVPTVLMDHYEIVEEGQ